MNLTPKQIEALRIIRRWRADCGYSPSISEMAKELGISRIAVWERVEALVKKGALIRDGRKARGVDLTPGLVLPCEMNLRQAGDRLAAVLEEESATDKAKAAIWKWNLACAKGDRRAK